MAGRAAATCIALNKLEFVPEFVEAAVGPGASEEFFNWVREANLPDPKVMLANGWSPSRQRPDIAAAAYASMTSYIVEMQSIQEKRAIAAAAWKILENAISMGLTDIALASAEKLAQEGLADEEADEATMEAAKPVLRHFSRSSIHRHMAKGQGGTP